MPTHRSETIETVEPAWFSGSCRPPEGERRWFETFGTGLSFSPVRGAWPGDPWPEEFGGGLAAEDFDGDGDIDLFLASRSGPWWFENLGGLRFAPRGRSELAHDLLVNGASAADFDRDGDIDLLLMGEGRSTLLRNEGGWRFEELLDLETFDERVLAASWFDADGDGWLDLYLCNFWGPWADNEERGAPDRLLLNQAGSGFVEDSAWAARFPDSTGCMGAATLDRDGDGRLELLTVNDKGDFFTPDRFFVEGADQAPALGLDQGHSGMGVWVDDFDNDGDMDVWKASTPRDLVLLDEGEAGFIEAGAVVTDGAWHEWSTWDVSAWDFDQDGDLDVLVNEASLVLADPARQHQVWENRMREERRFVRRDSRALGLAQTPDHARSHVVADFDGDGALDLVVPDAGAGDVRLYRGSCAGPSLAVLPLDTEGQPAVGARVELTLDDGSVQVREVRLGGQLQSSQPPTLWFGLGAARPELLRIRWLDGRERSIEAPVRGALYRVPPL